MTRMTLDDLVVPDTAAAAAALVASAYQPPALLNHSLHAYVWAAADGMARGIGFDPELLYVAAMFHHIGLVPAFDSHTVAFEEAGGRMARVFAAGGHTEEYAWPRSAISAGNGEIRMWLSDNDQQEWPVPGDGWT